MTNVRGRWGLGRSPQFLHGRHRLAFSDSILIIHFTGHHRNACLRGRSLVIERELVITPSDAVRPLCSVKLSPVISFGKAFFFFFWITVSGTTQYLFLIPNKHTGKGKKKAEMISQIQKGNEGLSGNLRSGGYRLRSSMNQSAALLTLEISSASFTTASISHMQWYLHFSKSRKLSGTLWHYIPFQNVLRQY